MHEIAPPARRSTAAPCVDGLTRRAPKNPCSVSAAPPPDVCLPREDVGSSLEIVAPRMPSLQRRGASRYCRRDSPERKRLHSRGV